MRRELADALDEVAAALAEGDYGRARGALQAVDAIDAHRLADALALARDVVRKAPRRRPLRRQLEALGVAWQELDASVWDAHALATGALRVLGERNAPAPELAVAVKAAAEAVRRVPPAEARRAAEAARPPRTAWPTTRSEVECSVRAWSRSPTTPCGRRPRGRRGRDWRQVVTSDGDCALPGDADERDCCH